MTATIAEDPTPEPGRPGRRPALRPAAATGLLAALAGAWLVPVAAHAARLDILLVPVLAGGAAVLFRSRGSVVDRLVAGTTLLAGLLLPAALLGTWWPALLDPVVLAGTGLTGMVLLGAARRPRRAGWRRPGGADAVVVAAWAALATLLAYPVLRHGAAFRLGLALRGEDRARHFAMADTIRRLGGYVLARPHSPVVADTVQDVHRGYPQGFHLLAAVLDNFWTGTTRVGDPLAELSRFVVLDVLCYGMLGAAVIWALRRVAGPAARAPTLLPLAGLAVGYLYFGDLLAVWYLGFAPEITGLAFLVVAVALLARPLSDTREQVLVVAAAVTAVAFAYYPLLPVAVAGVLAWAVPARRRLRRHWIFTATVAAVAVGVAAVPVLIAPAQGSVNMIFNNYGVFPMRLPALLTPAALVVAALAVSPGGRRWTPSVSTPVAVTLTAAAMAGAVGAAQLARLGHTAYFYQKSLHLVAVLLLVTLGTVAGALGRLYRSARWPGAAAATLALTALAVGAFAVPGPSPPAAGAPRAVPARPVLPAGDESWGRAYWAGWLGDEAAAERIIRVYRAVPNPDRRITVLDLGDWLVDYTGTLYLAALRRDMGRTWAGYVFAIRRHTPAEFVALVRGNPRVRYQIITDRPAVMAALADLRRTRADLDVQVVDARSL